MLTIQDFITKFENYSDLELFEIHTNLSNYSPEAKEALDIIINKRGGLDTIGQSVANKKIITDEVQRIINETSSLSSKAIDPSLIKTLVKSSILPEEKVHAIIDAQTNITIAERKDITISSRTVIGSIIGGSVSSVINGILLGLVMMRTQRIFYFILAGVAFLSYIIISAITKQSKKNPIVIITTIISVIVAVVIGQFIYQHYGLSR